MAFQQLIAADRTLARRHETSAFAWHGWIVTPLIRLAAVAAIIAISVFIDSMRAQPASLPDFARPQGAHEILNHVGSCGTAAGFGPYTRLLAFETERPFADIRREIEPGFSARGWTEQSWGDEGFQEYAPGGGRRINFRTGTDAQLMLARYGTTATMPTVIVIWNVPDCSDY
jgi:hypothetical protein